MITPRAAVCVFVHGNAADAFPRCLDCILAHAPLAQIELRLAFSRASDSFHYALGTLCADGAWPERYVLPGDVERFRFVAANGGPGWAWHTERYRAREQLARLVYHDVPLETEYAIGLEPDYRVEPGWWDTVTALMDRGIDLLGQSSWHAYRAGEVERLQAQPWYTGVPPARREGRPGVATVQGGMWIVRTACLRAAQFPGPRCVERGPIVLGEMAHQFGWSQAELGLPHLNGVG